MDKSAKVLTFTKDKREDGRSYKWVNRWSREKLHILQKSRG